MYVIAYKNEHSKTPKTIFYFILGVYSWLIKFLGSITVFAILLSNANFNFYAPTAFQLVTSSLTFINNFSDFK